MTKFTEKNEIEKQEKSSCLNFLIPALCTIIILAHFVSSFFPEARLWGINHLAYFPLEYAIVLTAFFFVFLIPGINSKILNLLRIPTDLIYKFTFGRSKKLWFFLFSLISFPLFWIFRTRTHFLGDGSHIIENLEKGAFFVKWTEPVETFIFIYLYKLLNPLLSLDAQTLYELVSCFYGAIFVFLIFLVVDFLGQDRWEKLFLFFFLLFMGSIQLFCGYAEHYSFTYILIIAFIFLSIKYLKGEGDPFFPLLFFALALFSHVSVSYLLPSIFLLYLLGCQKQKERSLFSRKEMWAFLFLVSVTVLFFLYMEKYSWTVGNKYVPLAGGDYYAPGYSLFSTAHILDILNQQLLISPVGVVVLISVWICTKAFYLKDKTSAFLFSTLILGLGFNSIMYPGLGMSRDWDMFSSTAIGYTILAGYLLLKYAKKRVDFKYLGSVLVITAFFCTLPWVLFNTSEQKGVERFRNLLDLDPKKSRNGHYILAVYFDRKGLSSQVEKENRDQAEKFPELALVNQGLKFFGESKKDEAFELCQEALKIEPNFAEAYLLLGRIYDSEGVHHLADKQFRVARDLKPGDGEVYVAMGSHYIITQEYDSAFYYYRKALFLNVRDKDVYNNMGNIYSSKTEWNEAIRSYEMALRIDSGFAEPHYGLGVVFLKQDKIDQSIAEFKKASEIKPDFALAHYHLAYLHAQKGEKYEAERALELYATYASDEKSVAELKELIQSLLKE